MNLVNQLQASVVTTLLLVVLISGSTMIGAYIPPRRPRPRAQAVDLQHVTREAELLFSRAHDVRQQVVKEELQPGRQQKREVGVWLMNVEEIKKELQRIDEEVEDGTSLSTETDQNQVDQLRETIRKLIEWGAFPAGLTLYDEASTVVQLACTKLIGKKFERNLREILSWLDDGVCRIGVYGAGGTGKTTLATHVHDEIHRKLGGFAGNVYWVTVSDGITPFGLQSKIAKAIDCKYILEEEDNKKRAGMLRQALLGRDDSVLILDDVWKDFTLEEVGIPVRFKLLLTTRSRDVCLRMKCKEIVKVGCLSEEESWELFQEIHGSIYENLSHEAEVIARLISKRCSGLPLCIKVIAASMRGVDDIHEWRDALAKLTKPTRHHQGMEDEVFSSLKLSYDRLNIGQVQKCFRFCVLFPEDYEFWKGRGECGYNKQYEQHIPLVEAWIAEGLLEGMESRQEQIDKGYAVLNMLLNACLLEPAADNKGKVKMHDLVREMGIKIGDEHYHYFHVHDEREWAVDLTKASMVCNGIKSLSPAVQPNCPNLSTLLLRQNPITFISHDFFSQMKGLSMLDLSHSSINILPDSVSDLENLTALLLRGCDELAHLPPLAKLRKLRELDLSGCRKLHVFPQGMERLTSLKLLDLRSSGLRMSCIAPMLSHVQELRLDPRLESIKIVDLMQLVCLERLEGCWFTEKDDFCRYISSQQFLKLNCYELFCGELLFGLDKRATRCKYAVLSGRWKSTELVMLPRDIQQVALVECEFRTGSTVDRLPCLQGLAGDIREIKLWSCDGIDFVWSSAPSLFSPFEKLEILKLLGLEDFKGLVQGGALPPPPGPIKHLRELEIVGCGQMLKKLFTPNMAREHFRHLERLCVGFCEGLEEVIGESEENCGGAKDDYVGSQAGFRAEENKFVKYLPSLKKLDLWKLPKLKSICNRQLGTLSCESIEYIEIRQCQKLKKLPLSLPSLLDDGQLCAPPCLRGIFGEREWWESLEWDNSQSKSILQTLFQVYSADSSLRTSPRTPRKQGLKISF